MRPAFRLILAVSTAAAVCAAVWGQGPVKLSDRGYSLHFMGPASLAVRMLAVAAGFNAAASEFVALPLQGPQASKQVAINVDNARLYDLVEQVAKAIGRPLELRGFMPIVRVGHRPWAPDNRPRARTESYDIVLEELSLQVQQARVLSERAGEVKRTRSATFRMELGLLPASPAAGARMLGAGVPFTLTTPRGETVELSRAVGYVRTPGTLWSSSPAVRGIGRLTVGAKPEQLAGPGEYTLHGELILAAAPPEATVFSVPDDAGKTATVAGATVTLTNWDPVTKAASLRIHEPPRPRLARPGMPPVPALTGTAPTRVTIYATDAAGNPLTTRSSSWAGEDVRLQFAGDPARIVVWKLKVAGINDIVREPFDLTFTVPAELLEGV